MKYDSRINKELIDYIEQNIFPEYALNDEGHRMDHIEYVIRRSLGFAESVPGIDVDMVFAIAAYHDVALHIDRKNHERLSGERLMADRNLSRFFSEDQIKTMAEAVADHRSSASHLPRSIYGKIVSSADRDTSVDATMRRAYQYRLRNNPSYTFEENMAESRMHMMEKFGPAGYARSKMFFDDPEYDAFLEEAGHVLEDGALFEARFRKTNQI